MKAIEVSLPGMPKNIARKNAADPVKPSAGHGAGDPSEWIIVKGARIYPVKSEEISQGKQFEKI